MAIHKTQQKFLNQVIRVNHAGEYGAKRIYDGQLAIFKMKNDQESVKLIEHMKAQEDVHFDYFDQKILKDKIRPTIMQPIWNIAGFALGAATALISKEAAMTCTVAVEETIDEHYQNQLENLEDDQKDLKEKIEEFRQEELEHRDIGMENNAQNSAIYKPLSFLINKASKMAIAISSRL